ncbi:hypothetical protein [Marinicrinis sediminis]|uniref:SMI1/KNR4 family protein n=1 Tax=Marinicrinis sediminis TaxID=1652465 RepID=A0ABW5RG96_9BACL
MNTSIRNLEQVEDALLNERLEPKEVLHEGEQDGYRLMKDIVSGEMYLHYTYLHRDLSAGGEEEWYHHLMPLMPDTAIAIVLGEQPYQYPDHWHDRYLRNGPEGTYVWFDPRGEEHHEDHEAFARLLKEKLAKLKSAERSEGEIAEFLNEMDRWDKENT